VTDEQIALAKRAVACKGWRWMPGMLTTEGMRVVVRCFSDDNEPDDDIPDLTDPATLGCLLALVREAHDQVGLVPIRMGDVEWQVLSHSGHVVGTCEADALVASLEAAP